MSTIKYPKIISVTGSHSMVGKTTLCSILLNEFRGFGAIKFTKTPLYASLTDDIKILNQKGKDTGIFLESGAERVIWIQSPYYELENILKTALNKMAELKGVVIEGNSPVDFLNPHLIVFIIGVDGEIKPSALEVSKKADIIIINSEKHVKKLSFLSAVGRKGAKVFYINLLNRKGELDKFLCFVKEKINQRPH